jgi:hypothetical protein
MHFDPDSGRGAVLYVDSSVGSQSGFNAAAISNGRLWATHAEVGVTCWELDRPGAPVSHAQISPGPGRNLSVLESGKVILSAGSRIADESGKVLGLGREGEIIALLALSKRVVAVGADGGVSVLNAENFEVVGEQHRARRLSAAAALPWLGEWRLLLAEESGGILCVGLEDEVCTQYSSSHVGCRMVAGSAARVAAVSADRMRVVIWNAWDGRQPAGEIHLGSLAGHRIADIGFF